MKKSFILFCVLFFMISCETDEQKAIFKAQKCLNEATVATAGTCKNYLAGHTSPESYALRCAADFLAEGVTASEMSEALENRDATGTSGNSVLGMMGIISFRTLPLAQTAKQDCAFSGYSSYFMLADLAVISTKITSLTPSIQDIIDPVAGVKPTQDQMKAALDSITIDATPDDATKELVGESAISIQNNYCQAENDSSKVCETINNAITDDKTVAEIGEELLNLLGN